MVCRDVLGDGAAAGGDLGGEVLLVLVRDDVARPEARQLMKDLDILALEGVTRCSHGRGVRSAWRDVPAVVQPD